MAKKITEKQAQTVLAAFDQVIEDGPWNHSNFLRVTCRNLEKLRDDFHNQVKSTQEQEQITNNLVNRVALRASQKEVFLSLYNINGSSLSAWEKIIHNLPSHVISRAIYAQEADVQAFIKTRDNKVNEAYVSIWVNPNDILVLSPDKTPKDRFGKALITLKDKAVLISNMNNFTHMSIQYIYANHHLIKKDLEFDCK